VVVRQVGFGRLDLPQVAVQKHAVSQCEIRPACNPGGRRGEDGDPVCAVDQRHAQSGDGGGRNRCDDVGHAAEGRHIQRTGQERIDCLHGSRLRCRHDASVRVRPGGQGVQRQVQFQALEFQNLANAKSESAQPGLGDTAGAQRDQGKRRGARSTVQPEIFGHHA